MNVAGAVVNSDAAPPLASGAAVNADRVPSMGEATYRFEPSALASSSSEPLKMLAGVHGAPGRGALWKQPRRVSAPLAGSRANATTLADARAVTYTVWPSGLTVTPSAPSSEALTPQLPLAPSRPSVPSELRQPLSLTSPVTGLRSRIAIVPKLSATLPLAMPPTTYTFVPSGETAIAPAWRSPLPSPHSLSPGRPDSRRQPPGPLIAPKPPLAAAGAGRQTSIAAHAAIRQPIELRASPRLRLIGCMCLLEHDEGVALAHCLPLLAEDLRDRAGVLRLDGHLHLHRLEDRDRVALLDRVPDGTFDFPHRAGDMRLDLGHLDLPRRLSAASPRDGQ